jgi:hypothetical protein
MGQDDQAGAAKRFLETMDRLEAGMIQAQAALAEGRANLAAVVAALQIGHGCLQRELFVGAAPRVFLELACEAMGMSRFLRADHATIHPTVLSRFVNTLLYPEPTSKQFSDADLQLVKRRFGKDDSRMDWRVNFILASRTTAQVPKRRAG